MTTLKPEIIEDIEEVVSVVLDTYPASSETARAALRVEAWLATYDPRNL